MSPGTRDWRVKRIDERAVGKLEKELGVRVETARCLVDKGLEDVACAGSFLRPRLADLRPPRGLAGFEATVARLTAAVRAGERIGVFGDYDVDGVTAAAILTLFLRGAGADVVTKVARRDRGYGFGEADAGELVEHGCRVVVTVDCGTSDLPAIERCRAVGVDAIVVDHHQVPERAEHPAFALLNPHRPDSTYPFRGLCSAGLAFFVAAAARTLLKQGGWFDTRPEPDVRALLDLVAVGTVADMAPLREENRILVAMGLAELSLRKRPGLAALLELAGVDADRAIDESDIGWRIGPRMNAPGRLGDAEPSLRLLLATTRDEAAPLARRLEELNDQRRLICGRMVDEALIDAAACADDAAILVARAGWHPGVAGIVAARLVDKFKKPAAVVALDGAEGRGSVRSYGGVDLFQTLTACREHLVRYGGHAQAAGLTVSSAKVDNLRRAFAAAAAARVSPTTPAMPVDAVVPLERVDARLAHELRALAPFGQANDAPVLASAGARVVASRRVGDDGSHLKLTFAGSLSAIAFGMGALDPGAGASIDVAFCPQINEFRGEKRVELRVLGLRPAAGAL